MSVRNGGKGMDLEVFVGTDLWDWLNWAPVSEGRLSIIEIFICYVLKMIVVDVGDTLGNLWAGDTTVQIEHLGSDLLHHISATLYSHQLIVELISSSDNLNIIKIMSVNGRQTDSTVVHLASENLVSEEVVAKKTAVTVGAVDALVAGDIGQIANHRVQRVVLLLHIVQVACISLDIVAAEDSLEDKEWIEIFTLPRGGVIKHTDIGIDHLIISDK
jgi:hypothetical protein